MEKFEYSIIRNEFKTFANDGEEFNTIDDDFIPDINYTCVDVLIYKSHFVNTLSIVEKYHDSPSQIFFATINGPKFIAPHRNKNKTDNSIRTHYGIIVHKNDDGVLNVGKTQYKWIQDQSFSFDTKKLHGVYKSKSYKRVILIVDSKCKPMK